MQPKTIHWKDRSHRFTPHFHVEFYVGVIVRGVCEFDCAGGSHVAAAGDLVLINPYEVHTAGCNPDVEYRAVYLDEEAVRRLVPGSDGDELLSLEPTVIRQSSEAAPFAQALVHTRKLSDLAAPLQRILSTHTAVRNLDLDVRDFKRQVITQLEHAAAQGVGSPAISELASCFRMSPQTFSRVFHRVFGVPAVFFRNQLRLHKAEVLLSQGGKAGDIAFECGFSDQAHLTRELKKFRGVTPKLYATAYQTLG